MACAISTKVLSDPKYHKINDTTVKAATLMTAVVCFAFGALIICVARVKKDQDARQSEQSNSLGVATLMQAKIGLKKSLVTIALQIQANKNYEQG
jgi:heme/copper-type cytochrome/quinol oxidase subunit 2